MSCNKECHNQHECQPTCQSQCGNQGNGSLCIIVLYILLVIILGSLIVY